MCYGAGGLNGDGGGSEIQAEEHDGAGGACARGSVATAYERRPGRLLKTSPSLLNIDECFIPAAARTFRSERSPPRCYLPLLRSTPPTPRSRSRRPAPAV
eukprot:3173899-Pleurochrysis_carterae.AAC.1